MIIKTNKQPNCVGQHLAQYLVALFLGLALLATASATHAAPTIQHQSTTTLKRVILQSGDVLYLSFPGEKEFNKDFPIDEHGRILLPEFGELNVSGKTLEQGKTTIRQALSKAYLQLDHLKIMLKERRLPVTILGQVTNPGKFLLVSKANAQQAIADAGGLLFDADAEHVQLRRSGKVTIFNYQRYLNTGDAAILPKLQPSDVLFVPQSKGVITSASWLKISPKHSVKILGAVGKPGRYEWSDQMTLIDLLTQAGGQHSWVVYLF